MKRQSAVTLKEGEIYGSLDHAEQLSSSSNNYMKQDDLDIIKCENSTAPEQNITVITEVDDMHLSGGEEDSDDSLLHENQTIIRGRSGRQITAKKIHQTNTRRSGDTATDEPRNSLLMRKLSNTWRFAVRKMNKFVRPHSELWNSDSV